MLLLIKLFITFFHFDLLLSRWIRTSSLVEAVKRWRNSCLCFGCYWLWSLYVKVKCPNDKFEKSSIEVSIEVQKRSKNVRHGRRNRQRDGVQRQQRCKRRKGRNIERLNCQKIELLKDRMKARICRSSIANINIICRL